MKTISISRYRKGFTLIELIIVIAILATLASIAYPTYMSIQDNASRTAAKKVCTDIVEGVTRFGQDNNGLLPYDLKQVEPDNRDQIYLESTAGKDARLIQVLTNRETDDDDRLNTTRDTYLRADEQEQARDGLYIDEDGGVSYYDPWGEPYYIVLCEEEEGCIDPFHGKKRLRGKNCIVYSTGPDTEGAATAMAAAGKADRKDKRGKKDKKDDSDTITATELAEEALEDNVYSWKSLN